MQLADLETLKQSSRLVHYCATPLLFDPAFRQQIQTDQQGKVEGKVSVSKCQWGWALCTGPEGGFAIFSQDKAALSLSLHYRMNSHPIRWRLRKSLGPQAFLLQSHHPWESLISFFWPGNSWLSLAKLSESAVWY